MGAILLAIVESQALGRGGVGLGWLSKAYQDKAFYVAAVVKPACIFFFCTFSADFRRAKTINIFGSSREAPGDWKTTGRVRPQEKVDRFSPR